VDQSYEVKDLNLVQEGKIPDTCSAVLVVGPTKAFFEKEISTLQEYLNNGGRALIATELNIKGPEFVPELMKVLEDWYVKPVSALIVDPLMQMFGGNAVLPAMPTYAKDHPATQALQGTGQMSLLFPFSRPLEIMSGVPSELKVKWLVQSSPQAFGITDLVKLKNGGAVQFAPDRDKKGPLNTAISIEGKKKGSKATRDTRLVVVGSAQWANNAFYRHQLNLDFFLNAVSWIVDDESLISIRSKEEGAGKLELSNRAGRVVFLITVILLPLLIASAGVAAWIYRRRL